MVAGNPRTHRLTPQRPRSEQYYLWKIIHNNFFVMRFVYFSFVFACLDNVKAFGHGSSGEKLSECGQRKREQSVVRVTLSADVSSSSNHDKNACSADQFKQFACVACHGNWPLLTLMIVLTQHIWILADNDVGPYRMNYHNNCTLSRSH